MMHIHTLRWVPSTPYMECEGCDVPLRLATPDEARFVQMTDGYLHNGPMLWNNGVVVVPRNFSLYQEV